MISNRPLIRSYLHDPVEIYRQSFATIEAEVDLSNQEPLFRLVLKRLIHACGMIDIIKDVVVHPAWLSAVSQALPSSKIFCDSSMSVAGVIKKYLPTGSQLECLLDYPETKDYAKQHQLTLSAAAMAVFSERWQDAIILIGNAPTALYELIYQLQCRPTKPAAIIAFPVGFVGAIEAKDLLISQKIEVPFITLRGRRGGSAMAAAVLNAVLIENYGKS